MALAAATLGVRLDERPALLRDLAPGATFFADVRSHTFRAIPESEEGALIAASGYVGELPFDTETSALLEELFAAPLLAETRCEYAPGVPLWDLVIQSEPPVRVLNNEAVTVEIDHRDYALWVSGEGSLYWSLLAR